MLCGMFASLMRDDTIQAPESKYITRALGTQRKKTQKCIRGARTKVDKHIQKRYWWSTFMFSLCCGFLVLSSRSSFESVSSGVETCGVHSPLLAGHSSFQAWRHDALSSCSWVQQDQLPAVAKQSPLQCKGPT